MSTTCHLKPRGQAPYVPLLPKRPVRTFFEDQYSHEPTVMGAYKPIESLPVDPFSGRPSTECNSLPMSILRAHRHGLPLILRPDDIYLAVLSQVKFIISSRPAFSHETREIQFIRDYLTAPQSAQDRAPGICLHCHTKSKHDMPTGREIHTAMKRHVDYSRIAHLLYPGFTTSTLDDDIARVAVLLSAGHESEYAHPATAPRGIPEVTLWGSKADWLRLEHLLGKLGQLDLNLTRYMFILDPIVKRFLQTFKDPEAESVKSFWAQAVHCDAATAGPCRNTVYTGWMTAFCMFSPRKVSADDILDKWMMYPVDDGVPRLKLDGILYPWISYEQVPTMHVTVALAIWSRRPGKHRAELAHRQLLVGLKEVETSGSAQSDGSSGTESKALNNGRVEMGPVVPAAAWWIIADPRDGKDDGGGD